VVEFAQQAVNTVDEFVFLDRLHYLAAGGRISRTKAFFGDALRMKPVVRPTPQGVEKAGVVRNPEDQLRFALERLEAGLKRQERPLVMLEYTDNRPWVIGTVLPEIQKRFPSTEFIIQPLSHTSGAHMGPGTWGVAFLPQSGAYPGKG
jgi:fatty acid-binding protein DegV